MPDFDPLIELLQLAPILGTLVIAGGVLYWSGSGVVLVEGRERGRKTTRGVDKRVDTEIEMWYNVQIRGV